MNLSTACCSSSSRANWRISSFSPIITTTSTSTSTFSVSATKFSFPFLRYPLGRIRIAPEKSRLVYACKRRSESDEPIISPTIVEEVSAVDEEDLLFDELEDDGAI